MALVHIMSKAMLSIISVLFALTITVSPSVSMGDTGFHLVTFSSANGAICDGYHRAIEHGVARTMLEDLQHWNVIRSPGQQTYRTMQVDIDNDGTLDTLISAESFLANRETYSSLWILRSVVDSAESAKRKP